MHVYSRENKLCAWRCCIMRYILLVNIYQRCSDMCCYQYSGKRDHRSQILFYICSQVKIGFVDEYLYFLCFNDKLQLSYTFFLTLRNSYSYNFNLYLFVHGNNISHTMDYKSTNRVPNHFWQYHFPCKVNEHLCYIPIFGN